MYELQKFIVAELKKIHPRVYSEWAPSDATFPYVVYNFPTSDEIISMREDFILEINIWDQPANGSTIILQQLSDTVDRTLNRMYFNDSGGWSTRLYRINRMMIPDPTEVIKRRQLRYECKTYVGGI